MITKRFNLHMPEKAHTELKTLTAALRMSMTEALVAKVEELIVELRIKAQKESCGYKTCKK